MTVLIDTTALATETTLGAINAKTPALVGGAVPVEGAVTVSGVASAANQSTEITALAAILTDMGTALTNQGSMIAALASIITNTGRLPAQGQALSASSTPVVLPATQITALTPVAAITGFALEAGHLATIDSHTPALGQALAAASVPIVLTAAQATALTPPPAITGFALEAGHLAAIDTHTPALGQATMANSRPVTLASDQSIVKVGDTGVRLSASFTRSANTTAYSAGQVVTAAGGGPIALAGAVQAAGRSGKVWTIKLVDQNNAATPLQPIIYLFNAAPTTIADNAALALVAGDIASYTHRIALFETDLTNAGATSTGQRLYIARGIGAIYVVPSGTSLYAYVVAGAAYTPLNAEVFTLILGTTQD